MVELVTVRSQLQPESRNVRWWASISLCWGGEQWAMQINWACSIYFKKIEILYLNRNFILKHVLFIIKNASLVSVQRTRNCSGRRTFRTLKLLSSPRSCGKTKLRARSVFPKVVSGNPSIGGGYLDNSECAGKKRGLKTGLLHQVGIPEVDMSLHLKF